jgi:hypothetical protein
MSLRKLPGSMKYEVDQPTRQPEASLILGLLGEAHTRQNSPESDQHGDGFGWKWKAVGFVRTPVVK